MRRSEFDKSEDNQEVQAFLQEASFGCLATVTSEGMPAITPLNFAWLKGSAYFHGSRVGSKMTDIRQNPQVVFAVAKEYAIIPSYFSDPELACPATTYFKSVMLRGVAEEVGDLQEKADALNALMRKLQPEGGYRPITPEDPDYLPRLRSIAVIKLRVEGLSAKFKFGQNLKDESRTYITDRLEERGAGLDAETAALMRQYCLHHQADD